MEHQRRADLMLLLTTSFWGISNCLTAICLRDMQPLTLNAFRFVIAFLVLGFVFHKNLRRVSRRDREVQYHGRTVACHRVYEPYLRCALYLRFQRGLHRRAFRGDDTDPGVHRLPQKAGEEIRRSMILCLIGLALMTLNETLKPALGDVICLFAAIFYSVRPDGHMKRPWANEKVVPAGARRVRPCRRCVVMLDALRILETPALPGTAKVWAAALFLGIVCSGVCLVIQSVYQKHTTASRASLIFTLEPVFSAIFAFFLLGERIGVKGYIGAALMLASLVLVEVDVGALFKRNKKKAE